MSAVVLGNDDAPPTLAVTSGMTTRRITRGQQVADICLAVVFAAVGIMQLVVPNDDGHYGGHFALNVTLSLLMAGALAVRRLWPVLAAGVPLAASLLVALFVPMSSSFWGMGVPAGILVYGAARWGTRRESMVVAAIPMLLFPAMAIHTPAYRTWSEIAYPILMLSAVWGAGRVIKRLDHQRRDLAAALARLDEQQREQHRQAVLGERARIAREMHDVVAHGVSVMVVQAGSARVELPEGADAPRQSLLAVETTGREVLGELRRVVSLLRDDDDPAVQPSPGLADLQTLVESMRSAGLRVNLDMPDGVRADPGRELTAYRTVQEALTNALRHAGHTSVDVRVALTDGVLAVDVVDAGPAAGHTAPKRTGGGNGLLGLRERIAMYGGRFDSGAETGGFAVRADIPLEVR